MYLSNLVDISPMFQEKTNNIIKSISRGIH